MHTSGDDTDGQDGPNLLDTDEDDNEEIQNNQDRKDMGDSAVELTEESEADMDTDLPALTTKNSDTNTNKTGYNSPDIWIEESLRHNTELDNFIQAVIALTTDDLPRNRMKHLSQWFQEGYVGEIKMPLGIKSNVYLDNIVIYSEGQTEGSLSYMSDRLHHYVEGVDGRWYPKKQCQNPNSPDKKTGLAGTWSTTVWAHFQRKFPAYNKQEVDNQARKTDSLKESLKDNQSRLPETKRTLSNWSWSVRITTACLIVTTAIKLISAHLNN